MNIITSDTYNIHVEQVQNEDYRKPFDELNFFLLPKKRDTSAATFSFFTFNFDALQ